MTQDRLLQMVISVMISGGYLVSERFSMRPRSFDLIASNGKMTLVIKVVSHIDSVNEETAFDLEIVARHLKGSSIIIGETGPGCGTRAWRCISPVRDLCDQRFHALRLRRRGDPTPDLCITWWPVCSD